jgi:hypothetical protein
MESFRVNYFLIIVDAAIAWLTSRFEKLKTFEKVFGFLFNSENLKFLDDNDSPLLPCRVPSSASDKSTDEPCAGKLARVVLAGSF